MLAACTMCCVFVCVCRGGRVVSSDGTSHKRGGWSKRKTRTVHNIYTERERASSVESIFLFILVQS